ncbi:MAG: glycosyltransferase family 2 protein [Cytophagales bacterium]|nr:glycosyltransferase family 2 protein [Cytophagales bacterium]MDW8384416.1 glycosyltransferase family 2 protein [Flammeovirgaceae bacterium]
MKVTGFSFVRNALLYDYPIKEAVLSILPLCDDFVIAVGKSEDATEEYVRQIAPEKIRIIPTIWDDTLREGGKVLALETNKALQSISQDTDWAFYIQADEVLHEKYLPTVKEAMYKYLHNKKVDGLLFNYLHFYGSYDYVGDATRWYRREIRVIRPHRGIYSYRDAQGFRKGNNQKLCVKLIDAYIYHYGWVKEPRAMQRKQESFYKLWHSDEWGEKNIVKAETFDYSQIDSLDKFTGTHPSVMQERIRQKNWKFEHDISIKRYSLKEKLKRTIEKLTGYRIGEYKNYKIC